MKNMKLKAGLVKRNDLRSDVRGDEGFTLIELLIVMSVMLILMALVVPQVSKFKKQANETSALQSIRAINNAEMQYSSAYPSNGFACGLAALGGEPNSGAPSAQAAQVLDANLAATGVKSGYLFSVTKCTKVTVNNQDMFTGYELTATPQAVNKTGDRGFCMDENGKVLFDPAGGTSCTQQIQ